MKVYKPNHPHPLEFLKVVYTDLGGLLHLNCLVCKRTILMALPKEENERKAIQTA